MRPKGKYSVTTFLKPDLRRALKRTAQAQGRSLAGQIELVLEGWAAGVRREAALRMKGQR